MDTNLTTALAAGALLLGAFQLIVYGYKCFNSRNLPYPPGPPGSLILGNLRDLPTTYAWLSFTEWRNKFGDIFYFNVFGKSTVVLNSYEDCVELLVKRSLLYSCRPPMPMMDLMGWLEIDVAFFPYSDRFKLHRRLFQQFMKTENLLTYYPTQLRKINDFLFGLLSTPEDHRNHCRTLPGAVIMSVMYGHDVSPSKDYYIELAERAIGTLSEGYPASAFLLDVIPILKYIPAWFPGAAFKRFGLAGRAMAFEMRDVPFEDVRQKLKEGKAQSCVAAQFIENCETEEDVAEAANVCATGYAGASDTTASALLTFFLAMTMFPDAQEKARREIDNVVGFTRLVADMDLPSLPHLEALFREVLRWRPVLPLSVAHATTQEDMYKGYYIPKGCSVVSNIWAIAHNHEVYPEPDRFNPDRFFNQDGSLNDDNVDYVFGFGRRICPGQHFAMFTLRMTFARVLQNFTISKKKDSAGKEIPVKAQYSDGLIQHPLPFECDIKPRSTEVHTLILEAVGKDE